jgi:hypothetical protein
VAVQCVQQSAFAEVPDFQRGVLGGREEVVAGLGIETGGTGDKGREKGGGG